MIEDEAVALLALLGGRDGMTLPALAKRLALGQSELFRLLTAIGNEPGLPGLGLVEVRWDDDRDRVYLTDLGREICAANEEISAGAAERIARVAQAGQDTFEELPADVLFVPYVAPPAEAVPEPEPEPVPAATPVAAPIEARAASPAPAMAATAAADTDTFGAPGFEVEEITYDSLGKPGELLFGGHPPDTVAPPSHLRSYPPLSPAPAAEPAPPAPAWREPAVVERHAEPEPIREPVRVPEPPTAALATRGGSLKRRRADAAKDDKNALSRRQGDRRRPTVEERRAQPVMPPPMPSGLSLEPRVPSREPLVDVQAKRIGTARGSVREAHADSVIAETPVALLYNGISFAVMLATPVHLEDFALGFSISEGIVANAAEWRLADSVDTEDGITLDMAIPQVRADTLDERKRHLAGRSGCGACGIESLKAALPPVPRVPKRAPVKAADIRAALDVLDDRQPLNARSGGVHAAAFAYASGVLVREDVGRHNALDKVLGARAKANLGNGFLLVTSRASYELVHKAATAGINLLVAISAPTALAIRTAEAAGITLVAFARDEAMNVYTHPEGIA